MVGKCKFAFHGAWAKKGLSGNSTPASVLTDAPIKSLETIEERPTDSFLSAHQAFAINFNFIKLVLPPPPLLSACTYADYNRLQEFFEVSLWVNRSGYMEMIS